MKQKNETNSILEKFSKLHEACSKYPAIVLGTVGNKPKIYKEPQGRAKNGFIEKFISDGYLNERAGVYYPTGKKKGLK